MNHCLELNPIRTTWSKPLTDTHSGNWAVATIKDISRKNLGVITDLILDWSDVAFVTPINCIWQTEFNVWREVSASTRTVVHSLPPIHHGDKLFVTLQINGKSQTIFNFNQSYFGLLADVQQQSRATIPKLNVNHLEIQSSTVQHRLFVCIL